MSLAHRTSRRGAGLDVLTPIPAEGAFAGGESYYQDPLVLDPATGALYFPFGYKDMAIAVELKQILADAYRIFDPDREAVRQAVLAANDEEAALRAAGMLPGEGEQALGAARARFRNAEADMAASHRQLTTALLPGGGVPWPVVGSPVFIAETQTFFDRAVRARDLLVSAMQAVNEAVAHFAAARGATPPPPQTLAGGNGGATMPISTGGGPVTGLLWVGIAGLLWWLGSGAGAQRKRA